MLVPFVKSKPLLKVTVLFLSVSVEEFDLYANVWFPIVFSVTTFDVVPFFPFAPSIPLVTVIFPSPSTPILPSFPFAPLNVISSIFFKFLDSPTVRPFLVLFPSTLMLSSATVMLFIFVSVPAPLIFNWSPKGTVTISVVLFPANFNPPVVKFVIFVLKSSLTALTALSVTSFPFPLLLASS